MSVTRFILTSSLAAGLVLSACGGSNERFAQKIEVVQGLRLQKVQSQLVADEIEAPGNVIAASTAQVAARTMGTVLQVAVREGDTVKRGQLLAQLDERELSAHRAAAQAASQRAAAGVAQATKAVAAAQAQADVMQKTFDRFSQLKQQNSVSPQEFDEISARHQAAQAGLEQAKAGLRESEAAATQADSEARAAQDVASYARITAPFDGRVIRRMVDPGTLITPGITLFIVEDTSCYQLQATLPAEALTAVRKNSTALVQLDALPHQPLTGKVSELEAGADPTSHTLQARVDLPKESTVRSGLFGRALFPRGQKQALLVNTDALVNRGQLSGIYIVDDAALIHWRVLTLGKTTGNEIEVLSGLTDGDVVVLNPGTQELDGKKAGALAAGGEKRP
jgi:multidrug efflux pump subunit AcrA (membrane-fusion protein)